MLIICAEGAAEFERQQRRQTKQVHSGVIQMHPHLAGCHNDCKNERPVCLDSVENKELTGGRGDGQDNDVHEKVRVPHREVDGRHELPTIDE